MATSAPWRADVRRSVALLRSFRYEQSDPDRFYHHLGADSVGQLSQYARLDGALVLDVGGGPGHPREAFRRAGARYVLVDADPVQLYSRGHPGPSCVVGSGYGLPVRTAAVDVCCAINVLEHVARPEALADEMLRVTRPGGTVYLTYTNWLSPNGGHETGPYHVLLGGQRAADRYARRRGQRPGNDFGVTLFAHSVARMLRWAEAHAAAGRFELLAHYPTYHPRWARWVINVPGLREVASWNVLLVVRPTGR
jgi:SAM-dependent methyltransferase